MKDEVIDKLLEAGVKHILAFGFTKATKENVITDYVYSQIFEKMLKGTLGYGIDEDINFLLEKIKKERITA